MSEQMKAAEPQFPRRVLLVRALRPVLLRLESRRSEFGDESPLGLPFGFAILAYRWSYRSFAAVGEGYWWRDWHLLVMRGEWHRSFYLGDERERP